MVKVHNKKSHVDGDLVAQFPLKTTKERAKKIFSFNSKVSEPFHNWLPTSVGTHGRANIKIKPTTEEKPKVMISHKTIRFLCSKNIKKQRTI